MKFPDDWGKVHKTLSIVIGDLDMGIEVDTVKDIKELLEEKKQKGQNEVVTIPGAKHGLRSGRIRRMRARRRARVRRRRRLSRGLRSGYCEAPERILNEPRC
jgi:hypothetical protein